MRVLPEDPIDETSSAGASQEIPALDDVVDELGAAASEEELTIALAERADASEIEVPRGATTDFFRSVANRLIGRRFIEDLGEHRVAVPWLDLHVPPSGLGQLRWGANQRSEGEAILRVMGSGFGVGQRVALHVSGTVPDARTCVRLLQEASIRVRTYSARDGVVWARVDVVRMTGRHIRSWADCPLCGIPAEGLDPFDVTQDQAVDTTGFNAEYRETFEWELVGRKSAKLALDIPHLKGVNAGVEFRSELSLSCSVEYAFPPGQRYQQYRPVGEPGLPAWAIA